MKRNHLQQTRGFTLIEFLLYLSLATVMTIVLSTVTINMMRFSEKIEVQEHVHETTVNLLSSIQRIALGSYAIEQAAVSATSTTITFRTYEVATDPTVIYGASSTLFIKEGAQEAFALHASNLQSNVVFTNVTQEMSADAVRVNLIVRSGVDLPVEHQAVEILQTTLSLPYTP